MITGPRKTKILAAGKLGKINLEEYLSSTKGPSILDALSTIFNNQTFFIILTIENDGSLEIFDFESFRSLIKINNIFGEGKEISDGYL